MEKELDLLFVIVIKNYHPYENKRTQKRAE